MFSSKSLNSGEAKSLQNVEIAHVAWASQAGGLSARESLLIAEEWMVTQQLARCDVALSILIDESDGIIPNRRQWLMKTCQRVPEVFEAVDYILFESDLRVVTPRFISLLVESNRSRRAREFQRYHDKHGVVACSHDVAIWHALRLGLLGTSDLPIEAWVNNSDMSRPCFFSDAVTSVLEETDREAESRGAEILRELSRVVPPINASFYAI